MKISDMIEAYIREIIAGEESVEISRNELANKFNCVPSQINYVISTRFIPELGFYVESRRGGGGYIKINRIDLSNSIYLSEIIEKIGQKMSQSIVDVYLNEFVRYNVITKEEAKLIKIAVSDKSLNRVDSNKRDFVRADIFKHLIINLV
ncbi:MAG: CtsR family transcriptional regulator [Clostridia bacterium]|nr:CtsR family transcriptional regulator [Clostridia bacterium]